MTFSKHTLGNELDLFRQKKEKIFIFSFNSSSRSSTEFGEMGRAIPVKASRSKWGVYLHARDVCIFPFENGLERVDDGGISFSSGSSSRSSNDVEMPSFGSGSSEPDIVSELKF